jgi:hypothetical protein
MIGTRARAHITMVMAAGIAALCTAGVTGFADPGHRVVGRIAELHLANSRALEELRKILRPQETLADASVWADTIKSFAYEDADTQSFRLAHPAQDVYHFTNIPFQAIKYDAAAFGVHWIDIVRLTRESMRVLRGQSQLFTRREALRLLAHFLGDIHQPLHVGSGFVSAEGPLRFLSPEGPTGWRSTLGGNALRYGPNDNFNLHTYWDTHVVNLAMQKDDVAGYAARLVKELGVLPTWRNTGDPESWPALWATESLVLSKEAYAGIKITTYLGPDAERGPAHRWRIEQPANYDDMAKARVRVQLAKGGYRLAATLKAIWPDSKP